MRKDLIITVMLMAFMAPWFRMPAQARPQARDGVALEDAFCELSAGPRGHVCPLGMGDNCPLVKKRQCHGHGEARNHHYNKYTANAGKNKQRCAEITGCGHGGKDGFTAPFSETPFLTSASSFNNYRPGRASRLEPPPLYAGPALKSPDKPPLKA